MDSDFIDTTPAWLDLDTAKSLVDGDGYWLQNSAGGRPEFLDSSSPVYLVLAASEPADRDAALKSAVVLRPGSDPWLYTPAAGRVAWICSPTGDCSLSINGAF